LRTFIFLEVAIKLSIESIVFHWLIPLSRGWLFTHIGIPLSYHDS
jgi:hypothetical protein